MEKLSGLRMKFALLLIDLQNDYFPGGKNPLVDSAPAAQQARCLLDYFRQNSLPVVHVQHLSTRPGASFFVPGTTGAEFYPLVQPLPGEITIQKHFPNSFRETPLLERLHDLQVERLAIGGMMTHMCLDAGVRAAVDTGFDCWVAADACATKDLSYGDLIVPAAQVHAAFLAALAAAYAKVMNVDELLAALANP
jgi:nicotinamidase-related amidase